MTSGTRFEDIPWDEVKKYVKYLVGGGGITEKLRDPDDGERIKQLILTMYVRDKYDENRRMTKRWAKECKAEERRQRQLAAAKRLRRRLELIGEGVSLDVAYDLPPSIPDSFYSEQVRMFRESEARKIEHHTEYGEWLVTEALSKSRAGCGASNGYYQQSKRRLATIKRVINKQRR